mmetsp:Transcript_12120/g.34326  ORF Transcript_12120/g.34326 Transcript_12120/m.34326 type:complete len:382 (-) Transcript_12120:183-1328(-)
MIQAQAVVEFGQPLQRCERPLPKLEGTEVLVKVTCAGVCHSDIHVWGGDFDLGAGQKLQLSLQRPFVPGHEIEGHVIDMGPEVPADAVDMTRTYAVYPWIGCSTCAKPCIMCSMGRENLCEDGNSKSFADGRSGPKLYGGYSSHVVVPHYKYLIDYMKSGLPEGLGCIYMCSGLTTFSALRKVQERKCLPRGAGTDLLILGLGGLGQMALRMAKLLFGEVPLAADISEEKRTEAVAFGSRKAYDTSDAGIAQLMKDTDGGVLAVIDLVGSEASFNFASSVCRTWGKGKSGLIVMVGLFGGRMTYPLPFIPLRNMCVEGSFTGSLGDATDMMDLLAQHRGEHEVPPHQFRSVFEVNDVYKEVIAGKMLGRCILKHDWPTPKM